MDSMIQVLPGWLTVLMSASPVGVLVLFYLARYKTAARAGKLFVAVLLFMFVTVILKGSIYDLAWTIPSIAINLIFIAMTRRCGTVNLPWFDIDAYRKNVHKLATNRNLRFVEVLSYLHNKGDGWVSQRHLYIMLEVFDRDNSHLFGHLEFYFEEGVLKKVTTKNDLMNNISEIFALELLEELQFLSESFPGASWELFGATGKHVSYEDVGERLQESLFERR